MQMHTCPDGEGDSLILFSVSLEKGSTRAQTRTHTHTQACMHVIFLPVTVSLAFSLSSTISLSHICAQFQVTVISIWNILSCALLKQCTLTCPIETVYAHLSGARGGGGLRAPTGVDQRYADKERFEYTPLWQFECTPL